MKTRKRSSVKNAKNRDHVSRLKKSTPYLFVPAPPPPRTVPPSSRRSRSSVFLSHSVKQRATFSCGSRSSPPPRPLGSRTSTPGWRTPGWPSSSRWAVGTSWMRALLPEAWHRSRTAEAPRVLSAFVQHSKYKPLGKNPSQSHADTCVVAGGCSPVLECSGRDSQARHALLLTPPPARRGTGRRPIEAHVDPHVLEYGSLCCWSTFFRGGCGKNRE